MPPAFVPGASTAPTPTKPVVPPIGPIPRPANPLARPPMNANARKSPVPLVSKKKLEPPGPRPLPQGMWRVEAIKGSKAGVIAKLGKLGVPGHHLNAITTELQNHPESTFIVNAHFMQENKTITAADGTKTNTVGKLVLHMDITPIPGFEA